MSMCMELEVKYYMENVGYWKNSFLIIVWNICYFYVDI